jgi:outer membrane protein OmpA-like peptidoglycan-associated protein
MDIVLGNLKRWAGSKRPAFLTDINVQRLLALPLLACMALSARGATIQQIEDLEASWPDVQLSIALEGHADDSVIVGDDIRYRLTSSEAGACYLLHLDSLGAATLMKPDSCEASVADASDFSTLFPSGGSLTASAPLGVEQVFAFLVEAPLPESERLLVQGQSFASLASQEDFDVFVNEVISAVTTSKVAMAELTYEVNANQDSLQFTTRGIVRKVVEGTNDSSGSVVASFDVQSILFEFGSADLSELSKAQLNEFGAALQSAELEGIQLRVAGHTDDVGGGDYNQDLSQQRAASVKQYFQDNFDVPDERLMSQGLGESKPLVPNDSDENRAINRRVEMLFVTQ